MKEKIYSINVVNEFGGLLTQTTSQGYCAQHALEEAIENGAVSLPMNAIHTAYVKSEETMHGAAFKIEFGAD